MSSFATVINITLKKGDTYKMSSFWQGGNNWGNYELTFMTGDAIGVEFLSDASVKVHAIAAGDATLQNYWNSNGNPTLYVFHVIDVVDVNIESNVELITGETFTYHPIVSDKDATTTYTWTSSNTGVATVASNGTVTAKGVGKTTIKCTAANGVSTQSLLTVSPRLATELTLSKQSQELSIGEEFQLQATISPANVTSSKVIWLSSNENVAQVDENGNVTAINYGYCSIFAIADDGSAKFDHCLITVPGSRNRGDVNNDGSVDVNDVTGIVNIIQGIGQ